MNKEQRLKMIKRIAKKVDRERKVASKLSMEQSVYMNSVETYNAIQGSGVIDTYQAMKEFDQWQ